MWRLGLGILAVLAWAPAALSQAAVEYSLQSGGSALSASGGSAHIAGCNVDATLLPCLSQAYPKTTIVIIGLLVLLVLRWLTKTPAVRY